jgi:hypothetical protein
VAGCANFACEWLRGGPITDVRATRGTLCQLFFLCLFGVSARLSCLTASCRATKSDNKVRSHRAHRVSVLTGLFPAVGSEKRGVSNQVSGTGVSRVCPLTRVAPQGEGAAKVWPLQGLQ